MFPKLFGRPPLTRFWDGHECLRVVHGRCKNGGILESSGANREALSLKWSHETPSFSYFSSFYEPGVQA